MKDSTSKKLVAFLPEVIDANDTHTFKFPNFKVIKTETKKRLHHSQLYLSRECIRNLEKM